MEREEWVRRLRELNRLLTKRGIKNENDCKQKMECQGEHRQTVDKTILEDWERLAHF